MRKRMETNALDKHKLERLTELLAGQCDVLRDLVAVAERQKQALLDADQPSVEAATNEQNQLLAELEWFESQRLALLGDGADGVAGEEGSGVGNEALSETAAALRLSDIIDRAPAEFRPTLGRLRDEARALLRELTALNETNAQLLRQELAFIDLYMSVLSPDVGTEVYGDSVRAKRQTGGASVAFDARA